MHARIAPEGLSTLGRRAGTAALFVLLSAGAAAAANPQGDHAVRSSGTSLAERIARRDHPRPDSTLRNAAGLRLMLGALAVTCEAGAVVKLSDAAGDPFGLAFHGSARLTLEPDPAAELVTRHNVRVLMGREHMDGGAIVADVRSLLVLGRTSELPDLAPHPPLVTDKETGKLRRSIPKMIELHDSINAPPVSHALAQADFNGWEGDYVHVLVETDAGDLLFVRDRLRGGRDRLYLLRKDRKVRGKLPLTALPAVIKRPEPALYATTRLHLEIDEIDDERLLGIAGRLEGVVSREGQRVLRYSLQNHQAGRDVPWDGKQRTVELVGVVDGGGNSLPFSHRQHELLVQLPEAPPPGGKFSLAFRLAADIAVRPGGDNYFVLRTLPWFPRAPGNAEAYLLSWKVRTFSPFVPLLSGETVGSELAGGVYTREARTSIPVRFVAMAAGNFHCQEFYRTPVVRICTYAGAQPRVAADVAEYLAALIVLMGENLAPYPFAELTVVELPAYDLAQATPGLMLLSQEILQPHADEISRALGGAGGSAARQLAQEIEVLGGDAAKRMAHELAHTWWGQLVKYQSPEDRWLSEAFAEYFGGVALAGVAGPEILDRLRTVWRTAAERSNDSATLATAYLLSGDDGPSRWWDVMYGKGALTVDAIRTTLGDEGFFRSLRRLIRDRGRGFATTADLTTAIQAETGRDLEPLLDRLVYGNEMP